MTKLNKKDQEFLDLLKQEEQAQSNRVTVPSFSIDNKKGLIKGYIDGETVELSNPFSITPLLLYTKYKRSSKNKADNYKVLAETVMIPHGTRGEYYDTEGTTMCGRVPSNATPQSWSDSDKEANKAKASFYGILYAIHKDHGVIRIQLPAAKAMSLMEFLDNLGVDLYPEVGMSIKLNDESFAAYTVESTGNKIDAEVVEALRTAKENADAYNAYIMSRYNKVNSYLDTPTEDNEGMDDEIPF